MQPISDSQYPNLIYSLLGKATDNAQKCGEYFAGRIFTSMGEMTNYGRTGIEQFSMNLQAEIMENQKIGSISQEDFDVDDRLYEKNAVSFVVRRLRDQGLISKQIDCAILLAENVALVTACSPIFAPPSLLSLPIRSALQKKESSLIGFSPKRYRSASISKFSVFTLNCALFQRRILSIWQGVDSPLEWKAQGIGRFLRDLKPSIICLQGVYHTHYAKKHIMARLLKKKYASVIAVKPGLLTASSYPIRNAEYFPLKQGDKTFELGVLLTTIKVAKDRYIVVANTRLIGAHEDLAGKAKPREEARARQLKQVRKLIRNYSHRSGYSIYDRLIVGDLGVGPTTKCSEFPLTRSWANPEYENVREKLLNKFKGLSYTDITEGLYGTQLEPHSATFIGFLALVVDKALNILKHKPIAVSSRAKGSSWKISLAPPKRSEIHDYFDASLGFTRRAGAVADHYKWEPLIKKRVQQALIEASDFVKANLFRYSDRTDHVCLAKRKRNLLRDKPRAIRTFVITAEGGITCDKLGVFVDFQQK